MPSKWYGYDIIGPNSDFRVKELKSRLVRVKGQRERGFNYCRLIGRALDGPYKGNFIVKVHDGEPFYIAVPEDKIIE